jgi:hypothetical protein
MRKMGSSVNTAANTVVQTSTNDIFQASSSMCKASCTSEFSGGNIVIGPGAKVGDITITNKCNSDALCTMKTELDAIATQQLDAAQLAEASAPGQAALITWPGFSVNTTFNFTTQVLSNTVTQVIDSVCQATADNLITNVNVYVGANAEVGAIEFTNEGDATAECAIENTAGVSVSQETTVEQSAVSTAGSVLVLIILIVGIAVILISLAWITAESKKNTQEVESKTIIELARSGAVKQGSLSAEDLVNIAKGIAAPPPPPPPSAVEQAVASTIQQTPQMLNDAAQIAAVVV